MRYRIVLIICCFFVHSAVSQKKNFVTVKGHHFYIDNKQYNYIGANYWYGGLLANDKNGKERVKNELDFLAGKGVYNLRIMAGAEGSGYINGVPRVEPALQPNAGEFNEQLLSGLDFLLAEMAKRNMKAVIFLSNNWEWSGGFLQYLNWNGKIEDSVLRRKLTWDEMRDYVSAFYGCNACVQQYAKQLSLIINRTNSITGKKYINDPAIMSWEIANEPRPMRPFAIEKYKQWLSSMAAAIKIIDNNHLVTIGSEGEMGSETIDVFKAIHSDKNIDYATIHIWPKNWGWFKDTSIAKDMNQVIQKTLAYIDKHVEAVKEIAKPLVIEEFGLPRDLQLFQPGSATILRNTYYEMIFKRLWESIKNNEVIAGANFWSFSGSGRPSGKQLLWVKGDDVLGDPPVEEQGLNSVFDNDTGTWEIIEAYTKKINAANASDKTK
jgi:mannan endo-1,4-beta-mannosidase